MREVEEHERLFVGIVAGVEQQRVLAGEARPQHGFRLRGEFSLANGPRDVQFCRLLFVMVDTQFALRRDLENDLLALHQRERSLALACRREVDHHLCHHFVPFGTTVDRHRLGRLERPVVRRRAVRQLEACRSINVAALRHLVDRPARDGGDPLAGTAEPKHKQTVLVGSAERLLRASSGRPQQDACGGKCRDEPRHDQWRLLSYKCLPPPPPEILGSALQSRHRDIPTARHRPNRAAARCAAPGPRP